VTVAGSTKDRAQTRAAPRQSQGAMVWRQFRRRRLAVAAAMVIVVLMLLSIWAPFLANDRPLTYVGINRFDYREAGRSAQELARRLATPPNPQPQSGTAGDLRGAGASSAEMRQAFGKLMDLVTQHLPPKSAAELAKWRTDFEAALAGPLDNARARQWQRSLRDLCQQHEAQLLPARHWPVMASLSWGDLFFLTWSLTSLTALLWWPRLSAALENRVRSPSRWACGVWLGVPAVVAASWWSIVPARIDRTPYKQGVFASSENAAKAPVVFSQVNWPVIPYAIDEDNLDLKTLPPAVLDRSTRTADPRPWSQPHWLGTDELGRDVLCRMLWGGRISLSVGIVAVAIYVSIGIVVGAVAGYFRGVVDLLISRVIEVVICFPAFFLILTIVAFLGPGLLNIMIVIGLTGWTGIARLVRGEFLRLVNQEFVLAGRALGYSPWRLTFLHILPNALAPVLVSATFGVAGAILTESGLSFLGMGISVPTPSWGSILADGRSAIFRAPWLIVYPGLAIFVTITCYNLVGEALRDASDPRLRGSR
jgi:peptide/nickel transport system permease protein